MPIDYYTLLFPIGTLIVGIIGGWILVTGFGRNKKKALRDFDKELREHGNFHRGNELFSNKDNE